jgi:hypothetical protein
MSKLTPRLKNPFIRLSPDEVITVLKFYFNAGYVSYESAADMRQLQKRLEKWSKEHGIEDTSWAVDYSKTVRRT